MTVADVRELRGKQEMLRDWRWEGLTYVSYSVHGTEPQPEVEASEAGDQQEGEGGVTGQVGDVHHQISQCCVEDKKTKFRPNVDGIVHISVVLEKLIRMTSKSIVSVAPVGCYQQIWGRPVRRSTIDWVTTSTAA